MKIIKSEKEFKQLEQVWNELLSRSKSDHINLTFEWMWTWWQCFGRDKNLFILLVKDKDEIIGIAPLLVQKISKPFGKFVKVKRLTFIAAGYSDSLDFIITRENEIVIKAILNYIFQHSDIWDEVQLFDICNNSPNYQYIKNFNPPNDFSAFVQNPYNGYFTKTSGNFESYYRTLSTVQRKALNKRIKRAERRFKVTSITETEITDSFIGEIKSIELNRNRSHKARTSNSLFTLPFLDFINQFAKTNSNRNWLKIFKLIFNDKLAAYLVAFDYKNKLFAWITSYDVEYSKYSVGLIVHKNAIEYCFDNSFDSFDFMRGNEHYKTFFCSDYYSNYHFTYRKNNLKMNIVRVYYAVRSVVLRLAKFVKIKN